MSAEVAGVVRARLVLADASHPALGGSVIAGDKVRVDLDKIISLDDFQVCAKALLGTAAYEYVASGTEDEQTLMENRMAFKRYALIPRFMRDVSTIDMSLNVFGVKSSMPIFISPAGVHRIAHPDGEAGTARACKRMGVVMGVSQHATTRLEDVAAAVDGDVSKFWYQLYILRDREATKALIQRAENAGYNCLCVTVDSIRFGYREADARNGFVGLPAGLSLPNYHTTAGYDDRVRDAWDQNTQIIFDPSCTWEDVRWVKENTKLPVVMKGILSPLDAIECIKAGASGIVVSNHGGRALDGSLAAVEALGPIIDAVRALPGGGHIPIFLDGGVRRGTDVLKALALGCTAVLLGRPNFFALATAGEAGVVRMLSLLREEFENAMALCGCKSLADITPDLVAYRPDRTFYNRAKL